MSRCVAAARKRAISTEREVSKVVFRSSLVRAAHIGPSSTFLALALAWPVLHLVASFACLPWACSGETLTVRRDADFAHPTILAPSSAATVINREETRT